MVSLQNCKGIFNVGRGFSQCIALNKLALNFQVSNPMSILNIRSKETVSISPVQNFHRDLGEISARFSAGFWPPRFLDLGEISSRSTRQYKSRRDLGEISLISARSRLNFCTGRTILDRERSSFFAQNHAREWKSKIMQINGKRGGEIGAEKEKRTGELEGEPNSSEQTIEDKLFVYRKKHLRDNTNLAEISARSR